MIPNRYSSPITIFDDESETDASSGVGWLGPENQLGLEPEFGVQQDDNEVNLEAERGEIKHYEEGVILTLLARHGGICGSSGS